MNILPIYLQIARLPELGTWLRLEMRVEEAFEPFRSVYNAFKEKSKVMRCYAGSTPGHFNRDTAKEFFESVVEGAEKMPDNAERIKQAVLEVYRQMTGSWSSSQ